MEHVYIKVEIKHEDALEDEGNQGESKPHLNLNGTSSDCILLESEFSKNNIGSVTSDNKTNVSIPKDETYSDEFHAPEVIPTEELKINGNVYENGKINRVSCSQCDKTFKNRANLKNHLKYVHTADQNIECAQCFRTFKSQVHLRSHMNSVHAVPDEVSCHTCHKIFLTQKKLKNHIYYTHPQPKEQVTCTVCSKIYKSHYNLKIHMKQVHPEGQSVPCPYCDKIFKVDMLLQRHIKWTHPDDGMVYKCQQCFKVLPSITCYKKHIENTHNASARATCELCNRIFKTKKSLDRHLKNVHNGKVVKPYVPSQFICMYCGRSFENNTTLFWHTQKHQQEGVSACDSDNSNTHCEICDKTYSDNASLQRHLASVHSLETATCHICMKEFKSAINLQSHMRITHAPPEAIQTCDICKKTFKCALHLRMHVNAVHTEGEFNCDECNKIFTSLKYLSKHKKTHLQTREHPCDLCGKMFKTSFAASKHKRNVHGGVKCSFCHIKQAKLDEHLLKCPKRNSVVKDSICIKCERTFTSNTELHEHLVSCGYEGIDPLVKIEVVDPDVIMGS